MNKVLLALPIAAFVLLAWAVIVGRTGNFEVGPVKVVFSEPKPPSADEELGAINRKPHAAERAYDKGLEYMRKGDYATSNRFLRDSLSHGESAEAHMHLGVGLRVLGHLQEAAEEGDKAVAQNPTNQDYINHSKTTHAALGR